MAKQRSQFGQDFSQYFGGPSQPNDPFLNPTNDAQRVENARARSGNTIGSGYLNPDTHELQDPDRGFGRAILSKPEIMIPLVVGGGLLTGAATAPGGFSSVFGGGGAGAAPEIAISTTPASVAAPTASGAVSGAAGPASTMSGFGKFFSKGLDPTSLLMMGLGFLGGDDSGQERQSFSGTTADPVQRLTAALDAIKSMGTGLSSRGPTRLRSSYAQAPPAPVQIPGLPFQIGGGLGVDPALKDPSLLESPALPPELGNVFAGPQAQPRQRKPPTNG